MIFKEDATYYDFLAEATGVIFNDTTRRNINVDRNTIYRQLLRAAESMLGGDIVAWGCYGFELSYSDGNFDLTKNVVSFYVGDNTDGGIVAFYN